MYFNAEDFDYNIENLLNDYYKYIKDSKTYKLNNENTFVKASRLDRSPNSYPPFYPINEDNNQNLNNNTNNSNDTTNNNTNPSNNTDNSNIQYIGENETELLRALYTEINKTLLPYVIEILDTFEYSGSPVYAAEGITREFLAQVIDLVLRRAVSENDPIDEIFTENNEQDYFTPWSRWMLMRSVTEGIILNEIFSVRRRFRWFSNIFIQTKKGAYIIHLFLNYDLFSTFKISQRRFIKAFASEN